MSNSPVNKNLRHQEVVEDKTGGTDSFNIPEIAIENKEQVNVPVEVKGSEPIVLEPVIEAMGDVAKPGKVRNPKPEVKTELSPKVVDFKASDTVIQ